MLRVVDSEVEEKAGEVPATLDELARDGARRMLMAALDQEVAAYLAARDEARDESGRARVVRNGRARARKVTVGAGTVEVRAPRVNDRRVDDRGRRQRLTSHILPPYMRRSPKVDEALPLGSVFGGRGRGAGLLGGGGRGVARDPGAARLVSRAGQCARQAAEAPAAEGQGGTARDRLRRYGETIAQRGGDIAKKKAVVAVARKLAVLLHTLWVTGQVYDPFFTENRRAERHQETAAA